MYDWTVPADAKPGLYSVNIHSLYNKKVHGTCVRRGRGREKGVCKLQDDENKQEYGRGHRTKLFLSHTFLPLRLLGHRPGDQSQLEQGRNGYLCPARRNRDVVKQDGAQEAHDTRNLNSIHDDDDFPDILSHVIVFLRLIPSLTRACFAAHPRARPRLRHFSSITLSLPSCCCVLAPSRDRLPFLHVQAINAVLQSSFNEYWYNESLVEGALEDSSGIVSTIGSYERSTRCDWGQRRVKKIVCTGYGAFNLPMLFLVIAAGSSYH